MRVAILNYGASNLTSVRRMVEYAGADPIVVCEPEGLFDSDRIILPGVGAAGEALAELRSSGLADGLTKAVLNQGRPFLGICLGMQLLADRLSEFGQHRGLGWIPGEVVPLQSILKENATIPHMGWNRVSVEEKGDSLFHGISENSDFYFAHSFAFQTPKTNVVATTSTYGTRITAAIMKGNVFATQFHPEKSQVNGEKLIESFLQWKPDSVEATSYS